jgi:hypothetical protein
MIAPQKLVYSVRLIFVSARTNKRHHHHLGKVAHRLLNVINCLLRLCVMVAECGRNWEATGADQLAPVFQQQY